jgi:hypothetical protein
MRPRDCESVVACRRQAPVHIEQPVAVDVSNSHERKSMPSDRHSLASALPNALVFDQSEIHR